MLRVSPALGRTFTDAEGEIGDDQKVILSYALWQRLYGGDPGVVGQSLRLAWTGNRYTIVGVMPRGILVLRSRLRWPCRRVAGRPVLDPAGVHAGAEVGQRPDALRLLPYRAAPVRRHRAAGAGAARRAPCGEHQAVSAVPIHRSSGMYSAVTPLQEALTRRVRRTLYLLWAGAGFVLLIGAINLANLSLARASVRRRELATRLALGAARLQVARQLMIEAMLPAALGGAAGIAVGAAILQALVVTRAGEPAQCRGCADECDRDRLRGRRLDASSGLLIGLVPAMTAGAVGINQVLGDGNRFGTSRAHGASVPAGAGRDAGGDCRSSC